MNSTFQPDSHPEAESLSAFAEQALSESEHSQILVHLATCSRCRQVVFLAQQAASEFEMQEAAAARPELDRAAAYGFAAAMAPAPMAAAGVTAGREAEKRENWWSGGWRLALVPAAALGAIVGLVIFVQMQHGRPGVESDGKVALNVPQAVVQSQPKPAEPPPADKATMAKAQPAAPPIAAKGLKEKMLTASASAPSEAFSAQPAPRPQAPAAAGAMSTTELNRARSLQQPQGQGAGMQLSNAALMPQTAPASATPRPELAVGGSFNDTSANAPLTTLHGVAGQAQASRSVSVSAMAPQSALKSASMGSFISSQQISEPRTESIAAVKAKTTLLPSGLRAASIVTSQRRTLAIDSSGLLFLSEDSGDHWQPVARQWSGRAIAVRVQGALKIDEVVTRDANLAAVEDKSSASNVEAVAAPPAVFEIVNDNNLIWTSIDGKTWKAK